MTLYRVLESIKDNAALPALEWQPALTAQTLYKRERFSHLYMAALEAAGSVLNPLDMSTMGLELLRAAAVMSAAELTHWWRSSRLDDLELLSPAPPQMVGRRAAGSSTSGGGGRSGKR